MKGSWIVILISVSSITYSNGFLFSFLNTSYKSLNCRTYTAYRNNYDNSFTDLVIATFFTFDGDIISTNIPDLLALSKSSENVQSVLEINIIHLFYLYPRSKCKNNIFDLFLDVLLNKKLLKGKPFKMMAILTHVNNNELTDLSNVASSISIPIFALKPRRRFHIQKIQKQYNFYDNVIYHSQVNIPKIKFLVNLTKKFNATMISIFHDYDDTNEIDILTSYLQEKFICINTCHMETAIFDNQEKINLAIEKDHSNIFVIISEKHNFLLNLMQDLNNSTDRKRILIIYNYYYPIRTIIDEKLNSTKEINFPLYVVDSFMNATLIESSNLISNALTIVFALEERFERKKILRNHLTSSATDDREIRNMDRNLSMNLISSFLNWLAYPDELHIEVEYITKINVSINHSTIYHHKAKYNEPKISEWKCDKCDHLTDLEPVCTTKICPASYYPVYLSQGCCWKCPLCLPGFVKPRQGQQQCTRCPTESFTNENQTKCIPFQYKYFKTNKLQRVMATIWSFLGCIYIVTYFGIFVWFRNTPMVRSSNLKLSIFQMLLHLSLNIHIVITMFDQQRVVCFIHSIIGFYLLKLIMSVYIIKTNQLLTIFQTDMRIDKNVCLTIKEIFFPVIYLAVSIFVAFIVLVVYKGDEYGLIRTTNTMEKYIYCKMTVYLYVDLTLVLVLSTICSIQSFLARKLPTNYNESYYT